MRMLPARYVSLNEEKALRHGMTCARWIEAQRQCAVAARAGSVRIGAIAVIDGVAIYGKSFRSRHQREVRPT